MSAGAVEAARPVGSGALAVGVGAAGATLLILRPAVQAAPAAPVVLAVSYAAIAAASLAMGRGTSVRMLSPTAALGMGLAGLVAAAFVVHGHPPAPAPMDGVALTVLAGVAEEAFFRRFLFTKLMARGAPVAIVASAVAFAVIHVPGYGLAALWVDLGAGSVLSWQRWASGTWTVPAATHVAANLLAVIR